MIILKAHSIVYILKFELFTSARSDYMNNERSACNKLNQDSIKSGPSITRIECPCASSIYPKQTS